MTEESLSQQLYRLGIPRSVYVGRRQRGLDHEAAITDCLARKTRKPRRGNTLDQSATGAAQISALLRAWKR